MGTSERRQREAMQRKRQILNAARKVFWDNGFTAATMPQIAAEAELAPGTLYLYFPGKDSLYAELLDEGYDVLLERLREAGRCEGTLSERGAALAGAFFSFAREYPEYFDILFFVFQRDAEKEWHERFPAEQIDRLIAKSDACKAIAAEVMQDLPITDDQQRDAVVEAAWSMLTGVVAKFRKRENFEEVACAATQILLNGLLGATGANERSRPYSVAS